MTDEACCGRDGLTAEFLGRALSARLAGATVSVAEVSPVGTGQVSDSFRLRLRYDRPADLPDTIIAKVPAADPASRNAARSFRTYEIEARFYEQLAPKLPVALPACYYTAYQPEPDDYVLLLEDLAPAAPGDELAGLGPADAAHAIAELAALHSAGWDSAELSALTWLNRWRPDSAATLAGYLEQMYPRFRERFASRLEPDILTLIADFLPLAERYLTGTDEPRTIVHGDFRADNLLFGGPAGRPAVLDWQTAGFGAALSDVAYFLGSSLPVATRRRYEEVLVQRYHAALTRHGVAISWPEVWAGYRRHAGGGLVMDIVAATAVRQTSRGDEMFATMARRHARQALDLGTLTLL